MSNTKKANLSKIDRSGETTVRALLGNPTLVPAGDPTVSLDGPTTAVPGPISGRWDLPGSGRR
ncbi:MAG: hypothetical protein AB1Z38_02475 [Desulfotignum sp.]